MVQTMHSSNVHTTLYYIIQYLYICVYDDDGDGIKSGRLQYVRYDFKIQISSMCIAMCAVCIRKLSIGSVFECFSFSHPVSVCMHCNVNAVFASKAYCITHPKSSKTVCDCKAHLQIPHSTEYTLSACSTFS